MALNTTLARLVEMVRAETGASTNVAHGVNQLPMLHQIIARQQRRLWQEFAWPHMIIERNKEMATGQRIYDYPEDIDHLRIYDAWVGWNDRYYEIARGFSPTVYDRLDPSLDTRQDPILAWKHYEGSQFEVWPTPASGVNHVLRFKAVKNLSRLTENDDTADLDDDLIVLFSAAEICLRNQSPDAQAKLQLAQVHYGNLRANSAQVKTVSLLQNRSNAHNRRLFAPRSYSDVSPY